MLRWVWISQPRMNRFGWKLFFNLLHVCLASSHKPCSLSQEMITIAKQEKHSRMWKIASTWECNARRQEKDPVLFPCTWWRLTILSGTCIHAKGMGKIECARTQMAAKPGVPLHIPLLAHHHVLTSPARIFPPAPYPPCTCHPRCLLVRGINRWFSLRFD